MVKCKFEKGGAGMANSHTKAVNKYNAANYDSLRIVVPRGQKEKINETLQRDEKDDT